MSNNFNYITKQDKTKDLFYKIPKQFMLESKYKKMKDSSKILYSILYERTNLSIKNNWFDAEDRAYIICTYDEIQVLFGSSRDKVSSCLKDLEKYNLIKKDKIKNNNGDLVNVYYVAHVETTKETLDALLQKHDEDYRALQNKNREYKREYNKKQSEIKKQKREAAKKVESENQTTVANTKIQRVKLMKPSNTNGSPKIRLRVVRKSDYNKTDFNKTDLVVVVDKAKYKKLPKRPLTPFEEIQVNQNMTTDEKIIEIQKIVNLDLKAIALLHKFIDAYILVSDAQLKMLKKFDYNIADIAIDDTISQSGETFSYFKKVYMGKQQEDIDNFVNELEFNQIISESTAKIESEVTEEPRITQKISDLEYDFTKQFYDRAVAQNWEVTKTTYEIAKKYANKNNLFCPDVTDFI